MATWTGRPQSFSAAPTGSIDFSGELQKEFSSTEDLKFKAAVVSERETVVQPQLP